MPIDFQGSRSKVKVMRSKTSIFILLTITQKVFTQFSSNKNQNAWCGLALMPIVGLSAILSVKVRTEGQMSPNCDFFFIFYISKAKISKLHRYLARSTKIDNSWSILSSRSKVKVKWSLNIKHSTSRNFLDIWQRNFKDSSKCPSWLEERFVYWQLFSIFNRYGDISKRRPPPPYTH